MKAENAFIPREIKGVELTEQEQNDLREGKKVLDAAESQFQAMESPASGGKHPRQAGGPSRCYRKGSGGHRRPGPAISIDAVMEQEQVG